MNLGDLTKTLVLAGSIATLGSCANGKLEQKVNTENYANAVSDTISYDALLIDLNLAKKFNENKDRESFNEILNIYENYPNEEKHLHFHLDNVVNSYLINNFKYDYDALKALEKKFETNITNTEKAMKNSGSKKYNENINTLAAISYLSSGIYYQNMYQAFTAEKASKEVFEERDSYRKKSLRFFNEAIEINPELTEKVEILKTELENVRNSYLLQEETRKKIKEKYNQRKKI